jgi:ribonucleases P/MRP protein subunit RPP40
MSRELVDIKWDEVLLVEHDVNDWCNNFVAIIENLCNKYVPLKIKKSWKRKVWVTRDVVKATRRKRKAWLKYRQDRSDVNKRNYDDSKKLVIGEIKKAVQKYEETLANNCKDNSKAFFKYIKSNSKGGEHIHALKNSNNEWVKDDIDMASLLNRYFKSVFVADDGNKVIFERKELKESLSFDMCIDDITEEIIEEKLCKLKLDKSAGPDGIHPRVLFELRKVLKKPLKKIFIKSLESGLVPAAWKEANVVPLFKKGSKTDVKNYRPVSITSLVGRLFEQIIKECLLKYLELNDLIKNSQYGFRKGRSCASNLIIFWNYIIEQLDKRHSIDVILLDLAKAFDKVSHQKLIYKLKHKGVTGKLLLWIENWLKDRRQRVVLKGEHSEWEDVLSGVPQGSVLGPLLFLVYIDDLEEGVEGILTKFADDSKLGHIVESEEDCMGMQRDLDKVYQWGVKWQMELNLDKCVVMHLGHKNRNYEYKINGIVLKHVEEERDLGVIIDNKLRFKKQCAKAANKANQVLGMINRNVRSRNKEVVMKLYKGLVRPLMEYSIQAWNPYKKGDIKLLERVQKRATKMIEGFSNKNYNDRLAELKLTTLEDRRLRGDMIMTYKMLNGFERVDTNNLWTLNRNSSLRGNSRKLMKIRSRLDIRKYSFSLRVTDEWNSLSDDVVTSTSLNGFKNAYDASRLKKYK